MNESHRHYAKKEPRHKRVYTVSLFIWRFRTGEIKLRWQNQIGCLWGTRELSVPGCTLCLGWGSGYTGIHMCQNWLRWTSVCFTVKNEGWEVKHAEQSELTTQKIVNVINWRTVNIHAHSSHFIQFWEDNLSSKTGAISTKKE